ncbi:altronate dehydratase [Algibacter amylolyticus]|uniref:Altronate dehydratase n=1 Tax=Algibacter amylolyticus TaxID=1608400 RepID=A0A5M7AX93_9FLAO|nr:altronate dehydratase family protein [Algibacter amylolyticus]KAA5821892.1 altronate dehydratase [Algibacter amylolyticus]MBB5269310.1 altronate hydrolase [Algibacter amylolyticus]TSJ73176.1 altronate dehydratase [Algibacter amylolyticus]
MKSDQKILKIHEKDNVLVALADLKKGTEVVYDSKTYVLQNDIPAKHKFVTETLAKGDLVYMYGVLVGKAKKDIAKGDMISTTNLVHDTESYGVNDTNEKEVWLAPDISKFVNKTFNGYHRGDGKVGTENNWLIIPLVFCQNRNVEVLKQALVEKLGYGKKQHLGLDVDALISDYKSGVSAEAILEKDILKEGEDASKNMLFPNVDGVKFLTHDGGCGGATSDAVTLCNLLAGYINNPNVAGATVLSLGCQHAQASILQDALSKMASANTKPVYVLEQQQSVSEKELLADAVKHTFVGLMEANKIERKPASLSKLVIGLECGGSDGFSGISANPTLGYVSDLIVGLGGATVLSEFPELNGVEQELINRCTDSEKAKKFSHIMSTYNSKAEALGAAFSMNPSPGNIKDGLITDAIKSAGAAKKGGTSPVEDVLDYTEQVVKPGLNLLCTPGNDVESTTGLAGSGCNVILFTTGLGTPTGNPITPVVKVSTNTKLFNKMNDIIDFNTGTIIEGEKTIEQAGEELLDFVIEVASGKQTKARQLKQDDFIPWKRGMSL